MREEEHEAEARRYQKEQERKAALEAWARITPARYADSSLDHPDFNGRLWDTVKMWYPTNERPWLGLIGATGRCKTRCAFMLLRLAAKSGECSRPFAVASYEFSQAVARQYSDDEDVADHARGVLYRATYADWLILDDLGKAKHTPAVVAALFALLDDRHRHNRTTIWTANNPPKDFTKGMPDDIAEPLRGRLLECSEIRSLSDYRK